ncbi:motile sperm domain-containing protein 2-like [Tachypleus tridentatus]|uniref:motile sperm domain-containing protein 2-like n=1 Tax=Tachypleus tridentatus TaxID=6853 RepID=UPI003FD1652E
MGRRKTKHEIDIETYSAEKDVNDLRRQFLEELEGKDWTDLYDPRDVQRLKDDDFYCKRFIRHQHGDMNAAVKMVKNTFKWRKDKNINGLCDITIFLKTISPDVLLIYIFYILMKAFKREINIPRTVYKTEFPQI